LSYYLAGYLVVLFCVGCHTGPSFRDDTAYRAIERESDRNSAGLAVTGAGIAAGVERVDGHAERVQTSLENLTTMIDNSGLEDAEKSALLRQAVVAQEEAAALRGEVGILREDTGRLNAQLAEQREISAALSAEHDKQEAAASAVRIELEATKEELAEVKGQRNTFLAILITAGVVVVLFIVFKVLRADRKSTRLNSSHS
jgi:hypothetical protein